MDVLWLYNQENIAASLWENVQDYALRYMFSIITTKIKIMI